MRGLNLISIVKLLNYERTASQDTDTLFIEKLFNKLHTFNDTEELVYIYNNLNSNKLRQKLILKHLDNKEFLYEIKNYKNFAYDCAQILSDRKLVSKKTYEIIYLLVSTNNAICIAKGLRLGKDLNIRHQEVLINALIKLKNLTCLEYIISSTQERPNPLQITNIAKSKIIVTIMNLKSKEKFNLEKVK